MFRSKARISSLVLLAIIFSNGQAHTATLTRTTGPRVNLLTVFNDALQNDPIYQQQVSSYLSSKQATPEARSALLPQLSLTGRLGTIEQKSTITGTNRYNNNGYGATLNQAVFNINAMLELQQAKASVRAAALQLSADLQALVLRVSRAYFNVLQAQDILRYTRQQRTFLAKTLHITYERYKLKHATITDLEFARGAYRAIQSKYYSAQIALYTSIQQLSEITGKEYAQFSTLSWRFPMLSPTPNKLSIWVNFAKQHNLSLNAARTAMHASLIQIKANKGNFFPTIGLKGSWNSNNGLFSAITGQKQNLQTAEIGLDANWPILQGGLKIAQVKRAEANYQTAWGLMRERYLNAIATTRIAYLGIVDGRHQALNSRLAADSYLKAVKHGEEAYKSGALSIYNVLQSQTRLFTAQQDYARDLYRYLINTLQLKESAGTLAPQDLSQLNRLLTR